MLSIYCLYHPSGNVIYLLFHLPGKVTYLLFISLIRNVVYLFHPSETVLYCCLFHHQEIVAHHHLWPVGTILCQLTHWRVTAALIHVIQATALWMDHRRSLLLARTVGSGKNWLSNVLVSFRMWVSFKSKFSACRWEMRISFQGAAKLWVNFQAVGKLQGN